ncbi:hypothetical protein I6B53_04100 [Schaalia sp. 19OD2882]|uniref:DUF6541 family protein n=1 Tax=Schaalia sp. 19OD2882 TaxID=2794089 RepID=UPI001C1F1896|nr:DUF6541 family protein [Schaalia sp. 19OD2882]QWW20282.1 hypothetical protein I6B53_04100 [Schaalia sp. 19OD2882]
MATWFQLLPAVGVVLAVLVLPGAAVALAAGARARILVAAAPLLSVLVLVLAAMGAEAVGVPWGLLPLGALTLVLVGVAVLVRPVVNGRDPSCGTGFRPRWDGPLWVAPAAVAVVALVHARLLTGAMGGPEHISQSYDGAFHLNLLEIIASTGRASVLHAGYSAVDAPGFYPAAWHDIASLPVLWGLASAPAATNAMVIVVTSVLWPTSMAVLAGSVARSHVAAAVGALASVSFMQMPNLLTWFGVLYPNLLATALLPLVLALLVMAFGRSDPGQRGMAVVGALLGLVTLGVSHPNVFFAALVLALPLFVQETVRVGVRWGRTPRECVLGALTGALCVSTAWVALDQATFLVPALARLRTSDRFWAATQTPLEALRDLVWGSAGDTADLAGVGAWVLAPLLLVGAVTALRDVRTLWVPLAHLFAGLLYVVGSSDSTPFKSYMVGLWYGDTKRLAALLGVTEVLLAALGVLGLARLVEHLLRRRLAELTWLKVPMRALPAALGVLVMVAGLTGAAVERSYALVRASWAWGYTDELGHGLLDEDELTLLRRLPTHVGPGETVLNNPWDGSVLAPTFAHRQVLFPHVVVDGDAEGKKLALSLAKAAQDPAICTVLDRRRIHFALDFGPAYFWGPYAGPDFPGEKALAELEASGGTEVVDEQGQARLLRLTVCDSVGATRVP